MKKLVFAMSSALLGTACGGGSPVAQYLVNVDNQIAVSRGPNAQCSNADPQNETITTDLKTDLFLSMYEEADGTVYAEFDQHVFTGKKSGDSYTLTDSESIEDRRPNNNQSRDAINSDVFTLSFKLDGDYLTGSITHEHHESCAGSGCFQSEQQTIDCVYSTNLRGRKLPDDGTQSIRSEPGLDNASPTP